MKKLVAFTCLLAAPLAVGGVAGAGQGSMLSLSPETVAVSQAFTATYSGCAEGDNVQFSIDGIAAGGATCDGGMAVANMTAPSQPGTYEIEAGSATAYLGVEMPMAGLESASTIALVGGAVLAAGVGLVSVGRFRRSSN